MAARDEPADGELIRRAREGDEQAFNVLYGRYRDWTVRLARRFTGNDHDALDVLQDAFAYLLSRLPGLTLTARMTTFLYPVVKNLSLNLCRKRRRQAAGDFPDDIPAPESPEPSRADLALVLRTLPQAHLEVVLMRFVDDMTLQEIAHALAIPLGTVKSRLSNALATLRNDPRTRRYFLE